MWLELLDAKFSHPSRPVGQLEFDQLLGHCRDLTDTPCNMFAAVLIAAYPDAKAVLIRRPFEGCHRSFQVVIDS
jgi:Sulfotransferase domain